MINSYSTDFSDFIHQYYFSIFIENFVYAYSVFWLNLSLFAPLQFFWYYPNSFHSQNHDLYLPLSLSFCPSLSYSFSLSFSPFLSSSPLCPLCAICAWVWDHVMKCSGTTFLKKIYPLFSISHILPITSQLQVGLCGPLPYRGEEFPWLMQRSGACNHSCCELTYTVALVCPANNFSPDNHYLWFLYSYGHLFHNDSGLGARRYYINVPFRGDHSIVSYSLHTDHLWLPLLIILCCKKKLLW